MAQAIVTQNTVFEVGSGALGSADLAYIVVGEVTSFSGFDGSSAEIDTTHLGSRSREYLIGLPDNGQFSLDCNFLPADPGQDRVRALKNSRDRVAFKITFSDDTVATFDCYVLSASLAGGVDGKVDTSFTLRITGDVTGV